MTEDRSPLTPEQIRDNLRIVKSECCECNSDALQPCFHCMDIDAAIQLLDSQALALTQQQQEIARLKTSLAAMVCQFAPETHDGGMTTGGLSALEVAFATLGWSDPHPAECALSLSDTGAARMTEIVPERIATPMRRCPDFADFPTAWAIQTDRGPSLTHHERCSSVPGWHALSGPSLLCDCGAVEYWRRLHAYWRASHAHGGAPVSP